MEHFDGLAVSPHIADGIDQYLRDIHAVDLDAERNPISLRESDAAAKISGRAPCTTRCTAAVSRTSATVICASAGSERKGNNELRRTSVLRRECAACGANRSVCAVNVGWHVHAGIFAIQQRGAFDAQRAPRGTVNAHDGELAVPIGRGQPR